MDDYYELTASWNAKFWQRFGGKPDLTGLSCLDLGCGVGALTIDIAASGASRVLGIDPDSERIALATDILERQHPELIPRVKLRPIRIQELSADGEQFDLIVARDTFEHIQDLAEVLSEASRVLRVGGILYAGFGPLWKSPFGDHHLLGLKLPWAHLVLFPGLPSGRQFRWRQGRVDLVRRELNFLTLHELEDLFRASPLQVHDMRVNVSRNPVMTVFSLLSRASVMKDYFTVNVYSILTKPGESTAGVPARSPA